LADNTAARTNGYTVLGTHIFGFAEDQPMINNASIFAAEEEYGGIVRLQVVLPSGDKEKHFLELFVHPNEGNATSAHTILEIARGGVYDIPFTVTSVDDTVSVILKRASRNAVLDEYTFSVKDFPEMFEEKGTDNGMIIALAGFAFLIVLIIALFIRNRRNADMVSKSSTISSIILFIVSSVLFFPQTTHALTFVVANNEGDSVTMSVGMANNTFIPGDSFDIWMGAWEVESSDNKTLVSATTRVRGEGNNVIEMTVDSLSESIYSGVSKTFTAPTEKGDYTLEVLSGIVTLRTVDGRDVISRYTLPSTFISYSVLSEDSLPQVGVGWDRQSVTTQQNTMVSATLSWSVENADYAVIMCSGPLGDISRKVYTSGSQEYSFSEVSAESNQYCQIRGYKNSISRLDSDARSRIKTIRVYPPDYVSEETGETGPYCVLTGPSRVEVDSWFNVSFDCYNCDAMISEGWSDNTCVRNICSESASDAVRDLRAGGGLPLSSRWGDLVLTKSGRASVTVRAVRGNEETTCSYSVSSSYSACDNAPFGADVIARFLNSYNSYTIRQSTHDFDWQIANRGRSAIAGYDFKWGSVYGSRIDPVRFRVFTKEGVVQNGKDEIVDFPQASLVFEERSPWTYINRFCGSSSSFDGETEVPTLPAGEYIAEICADPPSDYATSGRLIEVNDQNNCASTPFTVNGPTLSVCPRSGVYAVGETQQFTALRSLYYFSDLCDVSVSSLYKKDVTTDADWSVADTQIATVDNGNAKGFMQALAMGTTDVVANYAITHAWYAGETVSAKAAITVAEDGTVEVTETPTENPESTTASVRAPSLTYSCGLSGTRVTLTYSSDDAVEYFVRLDDGESMESPMAEKNNTTETTWIYDGIIPEKTYYAWAHAGNGGTDWNTDISEPTRISFQCDLCDPGFVFYDGECLDPNGPRFPR
jgi:hypothetical protein